MYRMSDTSTFVEDGLQTNETDSNPPHTYRYDGIPSFFYFPCVVIALFINLDIVI